MSPRKMNAKQDTQTHGGAAYFGAFVYIYADIDGDGVPDLVYFPAAGLSGNLQKIEFPIYKGLRKLSQSDIQM